MKQSDYILIQAPMVTDLGLSGNRLIIYALIHGYCKDGEHEFSGSLNYICEWTNLTRNTVIATLKSLVDDKLLNKREYTANNVKFCAYSLGSAKIAPVVQTTINFDQGGSAKIAPNNTTNNNTKEEKEYKEKVDEFVDRIYAMYPSTCPVRHTRLGKSHADKKKIKNLLKQYSREEIEKVVKQEVSEKYGKSMMQNFPTFLNHFPDPNDMFTKTGYGYPQSVADVKPDDINSTLIQFQYWLDRAAPTLCDNLRGGWPETEQQYQNMIKSTVGGATALSYVVLVFNRDGWDEYYDERGFMWTYLNYIKANGLYEG